MAINLTRKHIAAWQPNTPAAFRAFLCDVQPRILHRGGTYQPFVPTKNQEHLIDKVLESDGQGGFKHSISLIIEPRRHGKSALMCIILIWLFYSRKNYTISLLGNSELHCRRVQFQTIRKIIDATPLLSSSMQDQYYRNFDISFPPLSNTIQILPSNVSASFGDKTNCLYIADYHAAASDLSVHNAVQASLLDSQDSLMLFDSNVDATDGHVHALQREAGVDKSIYCRHIFYRDFAQFKKEAPAWIDRARARRLKASVLPVDFKRDILGQRSDAKNSLFPSDILDLCKDSYEFPVKSIDDLTQGRAYKIGMGLDRARSLFMGPNSDATVLSTVLKVASPKTGEPEFFLLRERVILPNFSRIIKMAVLEDHRRYGITNFSMESTDTGDISPWATDMGIRHELVGAYDSMQNASFPELHRICREGRMHLPASAKDLFSEMQTFTYTQKSGGKKYGFGHSSSKFHDDHVYALNLAVYALREEIMDLFTLRNIVCESKSPNRHRCYLLSGNKILFCSERCPAHGRVEAMYRTFKAHMMDSEITLPQFFVSRVKLTGARVRQAI